MEVLWVVVASLVSAAVLFIITKLMGHKQLAQLDFFDYVCGITIGSIAAEMATNLESPLRPLVAMIVYGGASIILNLIMQKVPKSRKYINGSPTILLSNGKLIKDNFKAAKLDLSEFGVMLREAGYFSINDVYIAVFEPNGKLTVIPKSTKRPVYPEDLSIAPKQEDIESEIIMDGKILHDNIKRMGYDLTWLDSRLSEWGYRRAEEVFFAVCDTEGVVTMFGYK